MIEPGPSAASRHHGMWRAARLDVIGVLAIAAFVIAVRHEALRHGMCFYDPTWYFHFGNRTLHGAVPYRDYIFQVGPLPVYVDAAFQKMLGESYLASQYAGLAVTVLRVSVMWMIARRLAGPLAAAGIVVFCATDPLFSFAHHWSTPYAQLFAIASGLFFVLASRAEGRRALIYLALAGCSAALIVTARQASAAMTAILLFVASAVLLARKELAPRPFVALWAGFAAGIAIVGAALALLGALGPAIQQMFLDAPQKKSVHGIAALLDAISGGALVEPSWWHGFLTFLAIPFALVATVAYVASRERETSTRTVATLIVPIGLVIGLVTREGSNDLLDLNRTFLSMIALITLVSHDRLRRWLGICPLLAIGLGIVGLAEDAAMELSLPGRGWGDGTSLLTGVLLIALASIHVPRRIKTMMCGALAMVGIVHLSTATHYGFNPFALPVASDGTLAENHVSSSNPSLRGILITPARNAALDWLMARVEPGSSCFVYGNRPVLYTLLRCKNPTRIDTTAADFVTAHDAEIAMATLRANPPDFLIANENQWMNPPLPREMEPRWESYDGLNPRASMAMHQGLRALLDRYEMVGTVADAIGPEHAAVLAAQFDFTEATRLYRRTR